MIYNLISSDLIKEVTFISVLFAFILPSTVPNPLASRVVPELSLY